VRRLLVVAAAVAAVALCGGCNDQANPAPGDGTGQFDQVETTLSSIEADVDQP
jgi:outer membrane murein-binding lipoprotein Lpp